MKVFTFNNKAYLFDYPAVDSSQRVIDLESGDVLFTITESLIFTHDNLKMGQICVDTNDEFFFKTQKIGYSLGINCSEWNSKNLVDAQVLASQIILNCGVFPGDAKAPSQLPPITNNIINNDINSY